MQDLGVVLRDESHPAHVGGEGEGLLHPARRLEAIVPAAHVEDLEFVGRRGFIFRVLQVRPAHPAAFALQPLHQMVADEPARSADQHFRFCHFFSVFLFVM